MKEAKNLDEALVLYKANKLQRRDFMAQIVDAIKDLQARIGGVDEAAVNDVRDRVRALETTIGNALIGAKQSVLLADRGGYTGVSSAEEFSGVPKPEPDTSKWQPIEPPAKRKPGRPPKVVPAEVTVEA